ncbi:hypothetical protein PPACK8108_LOCUS7756 [Phakopsora pachyrhizi]|uniref:Uncharacterized protein n=1 Tax=Phakopsora pachyrhizi TaxID=170000 RepID=A0AAV0AUX5_PHAPC|nr:hypothetical protein PPACK8108_LOCUS7756 [Phakopsora pachyrhizi]
MLRHLRYLPNNLLFIFYVYRDPFFHLLGWLLKSTCAIDELECKLSYQDMRFYLLPARFQMREESIITQQHKKDHSISPASAEWLGWNWSRYQETAKDSEEYRSNAGVMAEEQRKAHNEANLRDEQLMTSLASSAINLPSEKILYSRLATLNKDSFNSPVWKGRKCSWHSS